MDDNGGLSVTEQRNFGHPADLPIRIPSSISAPAWDAGRPGFGMLPGPFLGEDGNGRKLG